MQATVELQFMPCIGFFTLLKSFEQVKIEGHENYQKRSFRNKALLLSSQGKQSLTVPLAKGKNRQTPIQEVTISYDVNWINPALKLVHSCYGQSAYFDFYIDELSTILAKRHTHIWHLNYELLGFFCSKIGLSIPETTTKYANTVNADYRHYFVPNKVDPKTFVDFIHYPQVFESKFGFISNLSILDLLMNMGPESINYIPVLK